MLLTPSFIPKKHLAFTSNFNMTDSQLQAIAQHHGRSVYVYDAEKIESQYNRLTQAFGAVPNLRLNYATKALTNISILKWIHHLGCGLDTVSFRK